ncbi:WXG100 family type VII secretion target [Mycolicibacterium thermoresistibile]|jgi:WXG100 family type VII secretion target
MRYRVELEELLAFVEALRAFEQRAEAIASRVDEQIADLHTSWSGEAAAAHRAHHDEWSAAAAQMREALGQLREAAHSAHRNYTEAVKLNIAMLS